MSNEINERNKVRFIITFKILKLELQKAVGTRNLHISEEIQNNVCANAAKDLLTYSNATPSKIEIKLAIENLIKKLES